MLNLTKMHRWVERRGTHVEFGNIVGPFCGKPYKFRCKTIEGAIQLAEFASQIDADGQPVAVGPKKHAEYGAVLLRDGMGD